MKRYRFEVVMVSDWSSGSPVRRTMIRFPYAVVAKLVGGVFVHFGEGLIDACVNVGDIYRWCGERGMEYGVVESAGADKVVLRDVADQMRVYARVTKK